MAYHEKRGLNGHIKSIHENLRGFKCDKCEKQFNLIGSLNEHVKSVHENIKRVRNKNL